MKKLRLAGAATAMFLVVAGPSVGIVAPGAEPATAQTPVMVASGGEGNLLAGHSCALDSDGTVWCWGDNSSGQLGNPSVPVGGTSTVPVMVVGLPPAIDVSAGRDFTCAVAVGQRAWCWGDNDFGQLGDGTTTSSTVPVQIAGGIVAEQVSAGAGGACAVTGSETVECWGQGNEGQIGDGSTKNALTPHPVSSLTGVLQVSVGGGQACSVNQNGGLECWGDDLYGQLGNGAKGSGTNEDKPVPVEQFDTGVETVSAGGTSTCATVAPSSDLYCWGQNQDGQLGTGNTINQDVPTQVVGATQDVGELTAGFGSTCAVISFVAMCWGTQSRGVLGNGAFTGPVQPVPVPVFNLAATASGSGPRLPLAMSAGFAHTCAVFTGGLVSCWGAGFDGELGNGTVADADIPTPVVGLPLGPGAVGSVAEATETGCALDAALSAECWGTAIGNGTTTPFDSAQSVSQMPPNVVQMVGANEGGCVLTATGALWCWGDNTFGEIGNGSSGSSPVTSPVEVASAKVEAVSSGGGVTCAIAGTGKVPGGTGFCWGDNASGQVGTGDEVSPQPSPVKVKDLSPVTQMAPAIDHTCALILAGLVQCWGDNSSGQLGDNSNTQSSAPVTVSGLVGVVQVVSGTDFSCALTSEGEVWCWGSSLYGQLGNGSLSGSPVPVQVPTFTSSNPAVVIAAGFGSACAVTASGQIDCWGDNQDGQLGDPLVACCHPGAMSSLPVPVAGITSDGFAVVLGSEGSAACALNSAGIAYCWGDNTFDELGDGSTATPATSPQQVQGL